AALVAGPELERLEQRAQHQVEPHAELAQRVEARRERPVLEPADRIDRETASLREHFLGHAPGTSQTQVVSPEASGLAHGRVSSRPRDRGPAIQQRVPLVEPLRRIVSTCPSVHSGWRRRTANTARRSAY